MREQLTMSEKYRFEIVRRTESKHGLVLRLEARDVVLTGSCDVEFCRFHCGSPNPRFPIAGFEVGDEVEMSLAPSRTRSEGEAEGAPP